MTRFSIKLFLTYFSLFALVMVAGDFLLVRFLEGQLLTKVRQDLQQEWLEDFPHFQGTALTAARAKSLHEKLESLAKDTSYRLTLFDLSGVPIADSSVSPGRDYAESLQEIPEVKQALVSGQSFALRKVAGEESHWLFFAKLSEGAVFRVGTSAAGMNSLLNRVRLFLGASLLLLFLCSWLFSVALVRRTNEALGRFRKMVRGFEQGDFAQRFLVLSQDQVGELGQSMNSLAKDLEGKIRALAEERNRLKAILFTMQEGVIVLDAAGNIALFNPAMRRLFGLDESALGKAPITVIRNADLQAIVDRCLAGQPVEEQELRVFQGVMERYLMVQATPFANELGPLGVIVVMYDVTNLRRLERVRRDFVANVSHELKTPLTSIQGYVETLLDSPGDATQTRNFLSIIDSNARRLSKLVEDLLRLSEIESQQFALHPETFRVGALMDEVIGLHEALLKRKGMRVEVKVTPASLSIHADSMALTHILNNLLENAIKYGKPGTEIRIECQQTGNKTCFSVQDQGIGIPAVHLERIFERFYRVDKSRSRQEGSTGLGLAIVKHLVQLLGGEVSVESVEEIGTTFRFSIPSTAF